MLGAARAGGRNPVITCSDHFWNPVKVEVIFFWLLYGKSNFYYSK